MVEIWKDIKDYEGLYKVSNLGKIKSVSRWRGNRYKGYIQKERILKGAENKWGYVVVNLYKYKSPQSKTIHQLVAMSFLNHTPCGFKLVVNHVNFDKTDNRVENLEIVTNRENSNKKHLPSSSKYVGVSWNKNAKKWMAMISINNKNKNLGYFISEDSASNAYKNTLKNINK